MSKQGHPDNSANSKGAWWPKKLSSEKTLIVGVGLGCVAVLAVVILIAVFNPQLSDASGIAFCGNPPPVSDEEVKGKIKVDAKSLGPLLTSPSLTEEVTRRKTEIFSKYALGERALAYYQYQVCVLLMSDKTTPTPQKLLTLERIQKEEIKPRNRIGSTYEYSVLNKFKTGDVLVESRIQRFGASWIEIQNNVALFEFAQVLNDGDYVILKDRVRNVCLKIPIDGNGAAGYISKDECKTWQEWNHFYVKELR